MSGYYIRVMDHRVDYPLWWRAERCGYTCRLDDAGVYSEEESRAIQRIRGTDVAYRKDMVDEHAVRVADPDMLKDKWKLGGPR